MQMEKSLIFAAGSTAGSQYAASYLQKLGLPVTDHPERNVRYLLLDVPSFRSDSKLRGGGDISALLAQLPEDILICGGNLNHPAVEKYERVDFLQDENYLCENAYITAECAVDVALPYLKRTLRRCPVLVIGWGRIGKCLGQLLKNIGADVTIAARNPAHRAMAEALGYQAESLEDISLQHFRLIFNTVPYPIVHREQLAAAAADCVKIELASRDGMEGDDIIIARGLPGLHMPESSGKLIAETFIRLCYGR